MTTRPTIIQDENKPGLVLPTGYNQKATSTEYILPPCGIFDVDEALFNLFDTELGFATQEFEVNGEEAPINIKKPTVIFSAGERFAIIKKLRPIRDLNKTMMLPSISIHRTGIEQTSEDISGRGRNQMTGEYVVRRKLDSSDRDYQAIINKLSLDNTNSTISTRRDTGELGNEPEIKQGMLLENKFGNNIYEIITVPAPQFYTAKYDVIFWTNYMEHMNYMIETMLSSYLQQGKDFKVTCDKGYWFIAHVDDEISSQDNFDDFTGEKRVLKYNFTMNVKAFLLATNGPGNAVPFTRTISAPNIYFEINEVDNQVLEKMPIDKQKRDDNNTDFLLTDIEADSAKVQTPTVLERYLLKKDIVDPKTGKKTVKYIKLSDQNKSTAESVYKASDPKTMMEFLFPNKRLGTQL